MSSSPSIKEQARQIVDQLPEDADWEELLERIRVRRAVEAGLRDSEQGRRLELFEVRERFGLEPM